MGIIRNEEIEARKKQALYQDKKDNPVKYALIELESEKDELVARLVKSARDNYINSGNLRAYSEIRKGDSMHLEGNKTAEALIAAWMQEFDPSFVPNVKIDRDCSGNYAYHAPVIVTFTRVR